MGNTKNHPEYKILKYLKRINDTNRDVNIEDHTLINDTGITQADFDHITPLLIENNYAGRTSINKNWKIHPDGIIRLAKMETDVESDQEQRMSSIEEKTYFLTRLTAWITGFGAFGVIFQCYIGCQQNAKVERQTIVLESDRQDKIRLDSILKANLDSSNFRIVHDTVVETLHDTIYIPK